MEKTVVELFAGVGGFRVGLNDVTEFDKDGIAIEKKDWKFVWMSQWEPSTKSQDAFKCYCKRFNENDSNHKNEDISEVSIEDIPKHSLLVGGFPCQDYSVARSTVNEKGIQGVKGVLFWEIIRIVKAKQTPFILLENVDRLLKSPARQRGRDFGIMLRTFFDLGYNVEWRVINAADYGFAQKRRRVFIFAWKRNLNYCNDIGDPTTHFTHRSLFTKCFPIKTENFVVKHLNNAIWGDYKDTVEMTKCYNAKFYKSGVMIQGVVYTQDYEPLLETPISLGEVLECRENLDSYYLNDYQIEKMKIAKGSKSTIRTVNGFSYNYSEGNMSFPDDLSSPGRTMLTSEASLNRSTHVVEDRITKKLRFITEVEAERLQCFPDNWTDTGMSSKRRYFMMGNALVTGIIKRLEPELSQIIENE